MPRRRPSGAPARHSPNPKLGRAGGSGWLCAPQRTGPWWAQLRVAGSACPQGKVFYYQEIKCFECLLLQVALPATKPSPPASCRRQRGLLGIRISPPRIPAGSSRVIFKRNLKYLHPQQQPRDSDTAAGDPRCAQGAEPGLSLPPPSLHRVKTPWPLAFCSSVLAPRGSSCPNPHSSHSGARIKSCMGKISCFNHIWVAAVRRQTRARCHPRTWCWGMHRLPCTQQKSNCTEGPQRGAGAGGHQGSPWVQGEGSRCPPAP